MNELTPLLLGFVAPGVWRISAVGEGDRALAEALGLRWQAVDLDGVDSKAALMTKLGESLRLPEYFGHNWDALQECLGDQPTTDFVVITNADRLMTTEPSLAATLAEVLNDSSVAAVWVGASPPEVPAIPRRVELKSPGSV